MGGLCVWSISGLLLMGQRLSLMRVDSRLGWLRSEGRLMELIATCSHWTLNRLVHSRVAAVIERLTRLGENATAPILPESVALVTTRSIPVRIADSTQHHLAAPGPVASRVAVDSVDRVVTQVAHGVAEGGTAVLEATEAEVARMPDECGWAERI